MSCVMQRQTHKLEGSVSIATPIKKDSTERKQQTARVNERIEEFAGLYPCV